MTTRKNKTKEEISAELKHKQKIEREKMLVKLMFPIIEGQKTIYDAQTVLTALSGFVKAELDRRNSEILMSDLKIDLSKEDDSLIKTAILNLIDMLAPEKANSTAELLKRFGDTLAQFSANEYMKQPMKEIKITSIIAE